MKKSFFLLGLTVSMALHLVADDVQGPDAMSFEVKGAKKYSRIKSLLLCCGSDSLMLNLAKILNEDLDFTDQFEVDFGKTEQSLSQISSKQLFSQGTSLLIFFEKKANKLGVTVKDASSDFVVFEKTVPLERQKIVYGAHSLASEILETLTGDKGVCLSTLAYCKQLAPLHKVICFADYACKQSRVVVGAKTINVAPRWQGDNLYYSQFTADKNRLMVYNTKTKKSRVARSYPGLNMQPTFSSDGRKTVVCFSGGRGNSELYLYDAAVCAATKKRAFIQLTKNGGHNVSPCMLPDGNLVFCSDFQSVYPQIYHMDMKTKKVTRLTNGRGYAAAPAYCAKTNSVVYTRHVQGDFQLCVISLDDLKNVEERQITHGAGSKHEPTWSEDGRYVAFSVDVPSKIGRISQIAAMNYKSGKIRILTHDLHQKSFPRWADGSKWLS